MGINIKLKPQKTPATIKKERRRAVWEAGTNTAVGFALNQIILLTFSVPLFQSVLISSIMVAVSFLRCYLIRRVFTSKT